MINLNVNKHKFELFLYDKLHPESWYKCLICKIEAYLNYEHVFTSYYLHNEPFAQNKILNNLTCEEIIIKSIIE